MSTVPDWFQDYVQRGFHLVHYGLRTKGPAGREGANWPDSPIRSGEGYVDNETLVELRDTVPPSVHPSGETVELRSDGDIAHVRTWLRIQLFREQHGELS